ncbi:hypothetical protein [Sandaracinus amylolyticus]|uniref:Uncharacterized protein n=1 Tax=Sandaracinus amylolyticus TaxID=927083 RepID=A0A0F6YN24_9BACT|nr:hypothetical protein [Sandaracinus amylolyticus]AKF11435.1 hypothetical protein DB32_008584 [Sandaracinus amylolyticus]
MAEEAEGDPLLASLVASAEDGAIGLWLIVAVVKNVRAQIAEGAEDQAREAVLSLIREALRQRVLVVGSHDDGFDAWHVSPDDAVKRIDKEWSDLGRDPIPGEIATFVTPGRLGYA